ncbi:MAG: hypothetical protein KAS87_01805 [Candidatus Omnitrophica bacterium]|nr:hypothetical protein [Candidatus Omnitrophota bacterium]
MKIKKLKRFCSSTIAITFLLNTIPYPAYAIKNLHTPSIFDEEDIYHREKGTRDSIRSVAENMGDVQNNPLSPFELQLEIMGVNPSNMNDERFREAIRKEFSEFATDIDELLAFKNKWDWFKAGNYQNDLSPDIAGNNIANDLAYKFAKEKLEKKIEETIAKNVLKGEAELLICYLLREAYEKYNRGEKEFIEVSNIVESIKGGFAIRLENFKYLEEDKKVDWVRANEIKSFFDNVFDIYYRSSAPEGYKRAFLYTYLTGEMGLDAGIINSAYQIGGLRHYGPFGITGAIEKLAKVGNLGYAIGSTPAEFALTNLRPNSGLQGIIGNYGNDLRSAVEAVKKRHTDIFKIDSKDYEQRHIEMIKFVVETLKNYDKFEKYKGENEIALIENLSSRFSQPVEDYFKRIAMYQIDGKKQAEELFGPKRLQIEHWGNFGGYVLSDALGVLAEAGRRGDKINGLKQGETPLERFLTHATLELLIARIIKYEYEYPTYGVSFLCKDVNRVGIGAPFHLRMDGIRQFTQAIKRIENNLIRRLANLGIPRADVENILMEESFGTKTGKLNFAPDVAHKLVEKLQDENGDYYASVEPIRTIIDKCVEDNFGIIASDIERGYPAWKTDSLWRWEPKDINVGYVVEGEIDDANKAPVMPVKTYSEFKKAVCEVLGWDKDENIAKVVVSILDKAAKGEEGELERWINYLFYQAQTIDGNDKIAWRIIEQAKLEMDRGEYGKSITDEREKENIENAMIRDLADQAAKSSEQYLDAAISANPFFGLSQAELRDILSKEDNALSTMFITASSFFTAETMFDVNKVARPLVREELTKLAVTLAVVGRKLYIVAADNDAETINETRELLGLDNIALLNSIEVVSPIRAYDYHVILIDDFIKKFEKEYNYFPAHEELSKLLGKKSFILLDDEFREKLDGYQSVNKWWNHIGISTFILDRARGFDNTIDNPIMSILFVFAKSSDRLKEFADLVNEFPIEDADKKARDVRAGFFYGAFQYSPEEFEKRQEAIEECQRFVEML